MAPTPTNEEPSAPSGLYYQPTKRFDSISSTSSTSLAPWDGLRKDKELWFDHGDCLVHLYAAGTSRRGPSIKVPLSLLEDSDNHYLLRCLHTPELPADWPCEHELYIPAPPQATRREAFAYHVGTRNYFAYLASKPLVGESLALSLTDLAHRIESWQPHGVASTAFLDYCERQGYLDFTNRPDHAAAALYLADSARIVDIWRDAFAHCVGMRDRLDAVPDATRLDRTTHELIDHTSTAMWLHVERTTCALGEFLEEDMGPDRLGLTKSLRDHLDRFRSALLSHYAQRMGSFPPAATAAWDRRLWSELHHDFHCLYAYLMDPQSSRHDRSTPRGAHGGICVAQNVQAFDRRYGFKPLAHPLPLLPESGMSMSSSAAMSSSASGIRSLSQKRSLRLSWAEAKRSPYLPFREAAVTAPDPAAALAHATVRPDVMTNALVREYMRFERSVPREDRVSPAEARKVRWLLVYGMVQMLESITAAPPEVIHVDTPSYPLCIPFPIAPSWLASDLADHGLDSHRPSAPRALSEMEVIRQVLEVDRVSIRPDCQADSAQDYFTQNSVATPSSPTESVTHVIAALRSGTRPLIRSSSTFRSSVTSLHRSVLEGFSRVSNFGRTSSLAPPSPPDRRPSFREIVVEGYGNGIEHRVGSLRGGEIVAIADRLPIEPPPRRMPTLQLPLSNPVGPASSLDEPVVHSPTTTYSSSHTDWHSDSYASSQEGYESPASEISSASLRDEERSPKPSSVADPSRFIFEPDDDSEDNQPPPPIPAPRHIPRPPTPGAKSLRRSSLKPVGNDPQTPAPPRHPSRPMSPTPGTKSLRRLSLNAGCYAPTGKPTLPPLPTAPPPPPKSAARVGQGPYRVVRSPSVSSMRSAASSVYLDTATQAAEIEEVEERGRRRIRGLERLSVVSFTPADISLPQTPDEKALW